MIATNVWKMLADWAVWGPILGLLGLLFVDTLLGVIQSVMTHTFSWSKLGNFTRKLGMQVLGILTLGVAGIFNKVIWAAFIAALSAYSISLISDIISKISSFIPSSSSVSTTTTQVSTASVVVETPKTTSTP